MKILVCVAAMALTLFEVESLALKSNQIHRDDNPSDSE
jgi:hypothetical protein